MTVNITTRMQFAISLILYLLASNLSMCFAKSSKASKVSVQNTYCNPLNLEYNLQAYSVKHDKIIPSDSGVPHWREAADPACIYFKGKYFLFASVSEAYWYSSDMVNWQIVRTRDIPLDYWEPNLFVIGDELYYCHHRDAIYKTSDPINGKWTKVRERIGDTDSEGFFMVDNGIVYHAGVRYGYRGFYIRKFDPALKLEEIGEAYPCICVNNFEMANEVIDNKVSKHATFIMNPDAEKWHIGKTTGEGLQLMKHNGTYFLQFAQSTGSAFYGYRDYVFTARDPLGPWSFERSNPASYDPTGFCKGAGNSCVYSDQYGDFWRATTVDAEKIWLWERRLAIYKSGFDADNVMYTDTYLGELPQYVPKKCAEVSKPYLLGDNLVGWMLLSYQKPAKASSYLPDNRPEMALDESMVTWWSAQTGKNEWLEIDLERSCSVNAIQVNFAEQDVYTKGTKELNCHRYSVQFSVDGKIWETFIDKKNAQRDAPHDYTQLSSAIQARYLRLIVYEVPAGGKVSIRGFRVFGNSSEKLPEEVKELRLERMTDERYAKVSWNKAIGAQGYVVRYGTAPDKLYLAADVRDCTELPLTIPIWKRYLEQNPGRKNSFLGLTAGLEYYFTIDSFNERGITRGTKIWKMETRYKQGASKLSPNQAIVD